MEIYFLGTNGWYDTNLGNTISVLLDTERAYIIFDAGNGLYKLDNYIKEEKKPIFLLLSHFHLDHIVGLHILNKFYFPQGINIYGPTGVRRFISAIINTPYSAPIKKLKTKVKIEEFSNSLKLPVKICYRKVLHSTICYGYRLTAEGKNVAFCTDTGLCKNILFLAKKADILIAESSLLAGQENRKWPHLNPQLAALIAKKSKVGQLILVHFDASIYTKEDEIKNAERVAQKIFKNTKAARDGFTIKI